MGNCNFSVVPKRQKKTAEELDAAVRVSNPTVAEGVSRDVFGTAPAVMKGKRTATSGLTVDSSIAMFVSKSRQWHRQLRRGLVSYMAAAIDGICSNFCCLLSSWMLTFWMKQQCGSRDRRTRLTRQRGQRKLIETPSGR